ncbi:hypothetical protein AMELA_G00118930, partial [Ameiurus melas]
THTHTRTLYCTAWVKIETCVCVCVCVCKTTQEVGSGNTSQKSDEEDFVKVEDLPVQLSVMCEEELCKQILEEQRSNNLRSELLNGNTEGLSGLVGNAHALKEPGNSTHLYTTPLHTVLCCVFFSVKYRPEGVGVFSLSVNESPFLLQNPSEPRLHEDGGFESPGPDTTASYLS